MLHCADICEDHLIGCTGRLASLASLLVYVYVYEGLSVCLYIITWFVVNIQ